MEVIFIPKYPRDIICKRAESLLGLPSSFPKKEGHVDCIDIPVYAYGFNEDLIIRDFDKWTELHFEVMRKTGWTSIQNKDKQAGDLVLISFKGPHLGVLTGETDIIHACGCSVRRSSFSHWKRHISGVLTWPQHF